MLESSNYRARVEAVIYGSVAFAIFLLIVVALKYLAPKPTGCPQCRAPRKDDHPLCTECGWIFDVDDDDDDTTQVEATDDPPWLS